MGKRALIAFTLIFSCHYMYPRPRMWLTVNFVTPIIVMWEYGGIQRGIVNKIGLGYIKQQDDEDIHIGDWKFLTNHLIERLSSRRLSCLIVICYHLVVLLMPKVKMLITLFVIFIFIIMYKIYVLDLFFREFE